MRLYVLELIRLLQCSYHHLHELLGIVGGKLIVAQREQTQAQH